MSGVYFATSLVGIVINLVIFKYVYDLEDDKCLCSKDWKRKYIKYFSALLVFSGVLAMALRLTPKVRITSGLRILLGLLGFVLSIGSLVYLYSLYMFSHNLIKHKECPCSESNLRTFVYYYSIIVILAVALSLIVSLTSAVVLSKIVRS